MRTPASLPEFFPNLDTKTWPVDSWDLGVMGDRRLKGEGGQH